MVQQAPWPLNGDVFGRQERSLHHRQASPEGVLVPWPEILPGLHQPWNICRTFNAHVTGSCENP